MITAMLRFTFFFFLVTQFSYSQNSNFVWLSRNMPYQGYTCIDYNGNLKFRLLEEEKISSNGDSFHTNKEWNSLQVFDFNLGLLPLRKADTFYLIDINGEKIVNLLDKYSEVFAPSCGLYLAKFANTEKNQQQFTFLDSVGKEVIYSQRYYKATAFRDNISVVQLEKANHWNIIDKNGTIVAKLNNNYAKHITKIHSINEGRIVVAIEKPKLFKMQGHNDLIVVFDYNGEVVFSSKYDKIKSKLLNIAYMGGLVKIMTKRSNNYHDLNGNLIKSLSKEIKLIGRSKDYLILRDNKNETKLYNYNFVEVTIPSPEGEYKRNIYSVNDFGIIVSYFDSNNSYHNFLLVYEPKTLNKICEIEIKSNAKHICYPKNRVVEMGTNLNIENIRDLENNIVYETEPTYRVYTTLEESLKVPELVQYLSLSDVHNFNGLNKLIKLKALTIFNSKATELPSFENLKDLNFLTLSKCHHLTSLPNGIHSTKLKYLVVYECANMKLKTIIPEIKNLKHVHLYNVCVDKNYRDLLKYLRPDIKFRHENIGGKYYQDLK